MSPTGVLEWFFVVYAVVVGGLIVIGIAGGFIRGMKNPPPKISEKNEER